MTDTPIAESGSLRMMPPSTGFPTESRTHGTSVGNNDFEFHDSEAMRSHDTNGTGHDTNGHSTIPEHTILPPPVGMSSEEPAAETSRAEEQTHA